MCYLDQDIINNNIQNNTIIELLWRTDELYVACHKFSEKKNIKEIFVSAYIQNQ